jgi:2',3'-cyclic-nucleotide 2'-phosphodiesterase
MEDILSKIGRSIVVVDFHAEATSEKKALGYFLDGRAAAVYGTHTHVQTADDQILPGGTGYITDVGMTGPSASVLGVDPQLAIKRFVTKMPVRFQNAAGPASLCGVVLCINDKTGHAISIDKVRVE